MKNFLSNNNRTGALMTMLVLSVGAISIIRTSQFVMGSDGGHINGSIIACVYGACKDNTFNGGTSSGGGGGQPTPNTGTLTVIKKVVCAINPDTCVVPPSIFTIKVTGNNPSDDSFPGNAAGTTITLGPGDYTVSETSAKEHISTFSDDCKVIPGQPDSASGTITAGETQQCTITNTVPG